MFKKSGQGSAGQGRGCSDLIKFAFLSMVQRAEAHGEGCRGGCWETRLWVRPGPEEITAGAEAMREEETQGCSWAGLLRMTRA